MNLFSPNYDYHAGYVIYDRHSILGPRIQTSLQLVHVYEGTMEVAVDGRKHTVEQGESILLLPGCTERFVFGLDGPTHHGWCQVNHPRYPPDKIAELAAHPPKQAFTRTLQTFTELAHLHLREPSESKGHEIFRRMVECAILEHLNSAQHRSPSNTRGAQSVQRVIDYGRMHYAQVLQLDDLAKVAGVSPNHLIRLFKQELQLTPLEWLWRERIRQAETLLEHSGFSVSEIAFRCGFQNPYHFSRRFKETTGTSPKSYRQKRWKYQ